MSNSVSQPSQADDLDWEAEDANANASKDGHRVKRQIQAGMRVLKCTISEKIHREVKCLGYRRGSILGQTVECLLAEGLKAASASSDSEEALRKILRILDRPRFERLDKIRAERHTSLQQMARLALELLEAHLIGEAASGSRATSGSGNALPSRLSPPRPSNIGSQGSATAPRKVSASNFLPDVALTDATGNEQDESGSRPTTLRR